ncbi:MAG: 6-bladed beta-propeller [Rhodothermales bacterium]
MPSLRLFRVLAFTFLLVGCGSPPSDGANDPGYRFELAWGEAGTEPGQFDEPIGLAITGGRLFVSETGNNRIQVFDLQGRFLNAVGGDSLRRPMHLDAHDGRLYVPAYLDDRIHVISLDGDAGRSIGGAGRGDDAFDAPAGVAVAENGDVYVAEFFKHRVQVVSPEGTTFRSFGRGGEEGPAPGQFTYPTDVALAPGGRVVVADAYNNRIQMLEGDGTVVWIRPETTTEAGTSDGRFNVATAVEVGPDDRIYVADFFNHRIQVFSQDGEFIGAFGSHGSREGRFERPADIAFDEAGNLYVADFGNDRIQKFTPVN